MAYLALLTGLGSINFIFGDPNEFGAPFQAKYVAHLALVQTHAVSAVLALCLGPFQLLSGLRARQRNAHRWVGMLYLAGVLVASLTGFEMGLMAYGGLSSKVGFCLMAALWAGTGWKAYQAARQGRFLEHQRFMVRNYALTFGAVMVRVYLAIFRQMDLDFETIYPIVSWISWVPTLAVAEAWLVPRSKDRN